MKRFGLFILPQMNIVYFAVGIKIRLAIQRKTIANKKQGYYINPAALIIPITPTMIQKIFNSE